MLYISVYLSAGDININADAQLIFWRGNEKSLNVDKVINLIIVNQGKCFVDTNAVTSTPIPVIINNLNNTPVVVAKKKVVTLMVFCFAKKML